MRGGGEEEPWKAVEAGEEKASMEEKPKGSNRGSNIIYYKVAFCSPSPSVPSIPLPR